MNIGFLTSEYPHINTGLSGGIGTSIRSLGIALSKLDQKVTVFVYGQTKDDEFTDEGLLIIQIRNIKFKGLSWFFTRKKIEGVINKHVLERNLQIIEAPDWTGITSFMKLKCPIVIKLHGSDTYFCHFDNRPVKWRNYFVEKKALKDSDACISVSNYTASVTNELFHLKLKPEIIPNGIEINDFTLVPTGDVKNVILYVGTLIRKKGAMELPLIFNEVCKSNNDVELILVGSDSADIKTGSPSTWQLMKQLFTSEAADKVKYLGKQPHNEIANYYKTAEVCVFPSLAEAFPVSWIEAMAMGRAIVASDIGWANEVIENGVSGILVSPYNHEGFAYCILELLDNQKLRNELGRNAGKRVESEFSSRHIALKSLNFYKEICKA
jgi:glycosyltransferase involved in cell wall biosynthesis